MLLVVFQLPSTEYHSEPSLVSAYATEISREISCPRMRIHVVLRLHDLAVRDVLVTGAAEGETLRRFLWMPEQLVIVDRGYSNPPGIARVVDQGAAVLVRVNRGALPLYGEGQRQLDVLDRRLGESEYLAGSEYSIADIATWPWYGSLAKGLVYEAGEFLQVQDYKNVQRWTDAIAQRPAAQRGRMVNRAFGDPASQLHERHDASDFLTKTQDKAEAAG